MDLMHIFWVQGQNLSCKSLGMPIIDPETAGLEAKWQATMLWGTLIRIMILKALWPRENLFSFGLRGFSLSLKQRPISKLIPLGYWLPSFYKNLPRPEVWMDSCCWTRSLVTNTSGLEVNARDVFCKDKNLWVNLLRTLRTPGALTINAINNFFQHLANLKLRRNAVNRRVSVKFDSTCLHGPNSSFQLKKRHWQTIRSYRDVATLKLSVNETLRDCWNWNGDIQDTMTGALKTC